MSAILESVLTPEQRAQAAANDIAAGIDPTIGAHLSPFIEAAVTARRSAYISALRKHDWQWEFSDDTTSPHGRAAYEASRRMHAALLIERAQTDPDGLLWNTYAPAEFRVVR